MGHSSPECFSEKMSNIAVMLDKLILDLNRYTVLMYCWPVVSIQYINTCICVYMEQSAVIIGSRSKYNYLKKI